MANIIAAARRRSPPLASDFCLPLEKRRKNDGRGVGGLGKYTVNERTFYLKGDFLSRIKFIQTIE